MSNQRSARVMMEEEYMTLVVEYKAKEDRSIICDLIGDIEEKYDVHPEVVHQRLKEGGGLFSIEFSRDIYTHSRIPGEFIEDVLKKLNIEHCEKL
jgi:hypothetical protein